MEKIVLEAQNATLSYQQELPEIIVCNISVRLNREKMMVQWSLQFG